jgi:cellulose synthase/poly-beta-1,6-N-acetylglucosamine synthase-like glycosyltransferase
VIIPTRQRRGALRRALASLESQSVPPDAFEVIVSVDGSTDGTWEMLAEISTPYEVRVVRGPERGRASACNVATGVAQGDVLVILDDDMRVVHEFVESHRRHHTPESRRCVLGPVPIVMDASSPRAAAYVQAKFSAHLTALGDPGHDYTARDFYSGNTSLRRTLLLEVGGFDESFEMYGNEDVELFMRLHAAGVAIGFEPCAIAYQEYTKRLRDLARDTVAKGRTTVLVARLHPEWFGALRLAAPRDGSRAWLSARALLLTLSRNRPYVSAATIALGTYLERFGLWRRPLFYRALLDFAFWAGVDMALADVTDVPDLDKLAKDIHRGPLDLLLHG